MQTLERGLVNAGFLFFAIAILATLVFGRFLCGWGCHLVSYQDACGWLLEKLGFKPRPFRSRLLVLVPLGAAFYMFAWPSIARAFAGHSTPPWVAHFSTSDFWATFPNLPISILTFLVCGFLIVVFLGNKGFCTYACPYGAIFGKADLLAPGKILVSPACDGCGHCTATCTSNVRVHEEVKLHKRVVDSGCMKCLDCVDVCPKGALSFGFTGKIGLFRDRKLTGAKRYDLSWPSEIALAALFLVALYAYRGLYDAVPFLLALGSSAATAYLFWLAARSLRAPFLRLQHWDLRAAGRTSRLGWSLRGTALLLALFVGHSVWIQFHAREAEREIAEAKAASSQGAADAHARQALQHYRACLDRGLFDVAAWRMGAGSTLAALGDDEAAERELTRALMLDPGLARAHYSLGDLLLRRGAEAEGQAHLREAARLDPSLRHGAATTRRPGSSPPRTP